MDNVVTYSIRLQDLASPAMRQFTSTVMQSNNVVSATSRNMLRRYATTYRAIQDNSRATREMQSSVLSLARNVDVLTASLQRASTVKLKGGSMIGSLIGGNLATGAIMGGAMMLGQSIAGAIRAAFERQQIQASFGKLAGSEMAGNTLTQELAQLSKDTILGGEVFSAARTMMSFGIDSKDVTDRIRRIGDITGGDSQRLQSMSLALSQMTATGRLQGQDKLQMVTAGWNPLKQLSQDSGKSMAELEQMMSKGQITADMVWKSLENATNEGGKFYDVMAAIADTPMGKFQQLMGSTQELMVRTGQALMPMVTWVMEIANTYLLPLVEGALPYIAWLMDHTIATLQTIFGALAPIGNAIDGVAANGGNFYMWLTMIKESLQQYILPFVVKLLNFVSLILGDFINLVNESEVFGAILEVAQAAFKVIMGVVNVVVDALRWTYDNILKPIIKFYDEIYSDLVRKILPRSGYARQAAPKEGESSMPGMDNAETAAIANAATASSTGSAAEAAASSIKGGGQKVATLNVSKLFDNIIINARNVTESTEEIEQRVLDALARVLAQGALTV